MYKDEINQDSQWSQQDSKTSELFAQLVAVVAMLRSENGCPWDREQTHESITKNMIEEAYEAVEAIEMKSPGLLKEELGDVLLQVVLHAQIALEAKEFTLDEVIEGICKKLISRHPHVFGNDASFAAAGFTPEEIILIEEATSAESTLKVWDKMKSIEKQRRADALGIPVQSESLLASVPKSEPALMQAQDISCKAVAVGFEWEDLTGLTDKLAEEFEEFAQAEAGSLEAEEEFGDILFTLVNIARWSNIDAEAALRRSCDKFRHRWAAMEGRAEQEGFDLRELDYQGWDDLWNEVK
ncbi:MAG: nucleoside triphosphate pyrophosphohydrolase [Coriobacteriia bacterium]|nr:nucleoside triphosphate pyrophosphohydrolase [Coriobacteriia bacterium]